MSLQLRTVVAIAAAATLTGGGLANGSRLGESLLD